MVLLPIGTGTGLWPGDGIVNEAPVVPTKQPSYFNIIGVGARFLPWKKLSPQL